MAEEMGTLEVPSKIQVSLDPRVLMCSKCKKISMRAGGPLQCINGHIFCGEMCENPSLQCPVCDVDLKCGGAFVNCHPFMETLLDKVMVFCPFRMAGCTSSCMPRAKIFDHKKECSFWKTFEDRKKPANPMCDANNEVMDDSKENRVVNSGHCGVQENEGVGGADDVSDVDSYENVEDDNRSPRNGSADEADNEMSDDNGKNEKMIEEPPSKKSRSTRSSSSSSGGPASGGSPGDFLTGGLNDCAFSKCDVCGETFTNLGNLKCHQWNIHGHVGEATGKTCRICKELFNDKYAVARHIGSEHHRGVGKNARRKGLFCRFCGKKFKKQQELTTHILKNHQDKLD